MPERMKFPENSELWVPLDSGERPVIISLVLAERFFPGEDPIGRRFRFVPEGDSTPAPQDEWRTIVGVSPRILQGASVEAFHSAVVYLPFRDGTRARRRYSSEARCRRPR